MSSPLSDGDDNELRKLVELGLQSAQTHYQRQNVSIADAVNLFHLKNKQTDALPILLLIVCLFRKYGEELETSLKDSFTSVTDNLSRIDGLTDKWMDQLVKKFESLPS